MIKKSFPFSLALVFASLLVYGQHRFGIKANGGVSEIVNHYHSPYTNYSSSFRPSYEGGLFYNIHFGGRSVLGLEVLYTEIKSRNTTEDYLVSSGTSSSYHYTNEDRISRSSVGIPIYYGLNFNKLTVFIGTQFSWELTIKSDYTQTRENPDGSVDHSDRSYTYNNTSSYMLGNSLTVLYDLHKRFGIELKYFYGLDNILGNTPWDETVSFQQISLGLRFHFVATERSD